MKNTISKPIHSLISISLVLSLFACGGTEAELCAEQAEACLTEARSTLEAAELDHTRSSVGLDIQPAPPPRTPGVRPSRTPWGRRAAAMCAASYLGTPSGRNSYCIQCCNATLITNPDIYQWNVCIAQCNALLGRGGPGGGGGVGRDGVGGIGGMNR